MLDQTGADAPLADRVSALQTLIYAAAEQLQSSPKQLRLYRALYHTYIRPAATQELAAEVIDVPFSTYRRHLKSSIDEVVAFLWNRELGASGPQGL